MKIALLNFNRSGLFHYAFSLARALAENGGRILFVTSKYNDLSLLSSHQNLSVIALDAPHQKYVQFIIKSLNPCAHRMFRTAIRKFQPDAILINDVYPWYLFHSRFLSRYPVFFIEHDPALHEGEKKAFLIHRVQRTLRKISRQVIHHNNDLPHGAFDLFCRFQTGRLPEKNTALFFGRILPYKGLDLLIQAIEDIPEIKLLIAGEGDISSYLPLMKHPERYEIVNRYISEKEVPKFFERSQLVVLPYRSATQSGIIPIAYSLSRPVIATAVGLLPSVVKDGETGFLIEPNDLHALRNTLQDALQYPEKLLEMGKNAKRFADQYLGFPMIAKKIQAIVQESLDSSPFQV